MAKKENQWCHCITNDEVIDKAHAVLQFAATQFYGKKKSGGCCIGSLSDILNVAAHLGNAVSARVASAKMEEEGCPPVLSVMIAAKEQGDQYRTVLSEFNNRGDGTGHLDRAIGMFESIHELEKADEAFTKAQKGG